MMLIFELWLKNVVDSHERKGHVFFLIFISYIKNNLPGNHSLCLSK